MMRAVRAEFFSDFLPVKYLRQIRYDATPIKIYKIVQATGNSQAGGASGGWLRAPNCSMVLRVNIEIINPPPSGAAIQSAQRQILPKVVNFVFAIGISFFLAYG